MCIRDRLEIATLIRLVDGKPWYESYTGTKPVIYGHWAVDGPVSYTHLDVYKRQTMQIVKKSI